MRGTRIGVVAAAGVAGAVVAGVAIGAGGPLTGTVGPGYAIAVTDAGGAEVTTLDPGGYELTVDDLSNEHDFHLTGPGVDVATEVDTVGKKTFSLTLQDGRYTYICDVHPLRMTGSFVVGAPPPDSTDDYGGGSTGGGGGTGGSGGSSVPSAAVGSKIVLASGPGRAISLRTMAGKRITRLRPGPYTVLVRDRSPSHDARLRGAGVSKATSVPFVGTRTWKVVLRKGKLVFLCDAHPTTMRGVVVVAP